MEKLKGTAMAGEKQLTCSFTLVYKDLKMDLKKSKALCKPKLKKTARIPNYTVNGAEMVFNFTMTIGKKGKIILSDPKIKPLPTTTTTTTPTTTATPTTTTISPTG